MTKTSIEALEATLEGLQTPVPKDTPSVQEELLQEEGNKPEAVADELERKSRELDNALKSDDNERKKEIHGLRKEYVPRLFYMIVWWLLAVAAFVFLTGYSADNLNNPDCQINCTRFKLSDNVLIAFITTTTATVIGVFVIVAKWLFPSPDDKKEK